MVQGLLSHGAVTLGNIHPVRADHRPSGWVLSPVLTIVTVAVAPRCGDAQASRRKGSGERDSQQQSRRGGRLVDEPSAGSAWSMYSAGDQEQERLETGRHEAVRFRLRRIRLTARTTPR